jgi:NADPH-dependent 7-cyano-7-deazaguanine reductase QueF-like protein
LTFKKFTSIYNESKLSEYQAVQFTIKSKLSECQAVQFTMKVNFLKVKRTIYNESKFFECQAVQFTMSLLSL